MKKIISILMAVLIMISVMPMSLFYASAVSVDEAIAWCEEKIGSTVGSGQCVAFIQEYYQYLGVSAVSGNACDYATNSLPSGWTRVKDGVPQKGDILVYTGAKYGHVAIYAGGTVSYHQNMAGTWVEKKTNWSYNNSWYSTAEGGTKSYWGYIRPNLTTDNMPIGQVDSCTGGAGTVYIRGWTFDPDSTSSQLNIHIYIGNECHSDIYANTQRTDVNDVYGCGNYHGFEKTITTDLTGTQTVKVYAINSTGSGNSLIYTGSVNITAVPSYYVDVNMNIDGTYYGSAPDGFTFDLYLNGIQYDNDVKDTWRSVKSGTAYTINDIKCPSDYVFVSGETSGTITDTKTIDLTFAKLYYLDVNIVVNGVAKDNGMSGFTFDVYHNGTLNSNDVTDYYSQVKKGTTYEIKDIKCPTGYELTDGTTKGTVNDKTTVTLSFQCTHSSTELKNATTPTCTTTGYTGDTYCKTCGTKLSSGTTIPETGHNYSYRTYVSTCAKEGSTTYTCSCGASYSETIAKNPNNHEGGTEIRNEKSATCSAEGYTGDTYCKGCSVKLSSGTTIAKKAHNYKAVVTAPTCTSQGFTTYTCECGDSYIDNYTEKLDHEYTSEITTQPTHLTEGVETFTCSACGDIYTEIIAKIEGHTYTAVVTKQPTHLEEGETTYTCDCGDSYTEAMAKTTHHDYKAVVTAPTCTAEGYTIYTCECGDSYKSDYVAAKEHSYESKVTTAPTHTKKGVLTYTCSACGDSYKEDISKLPDHKYTVKGVKTPTCTAEGYTTFVCACGDTYKSDYIPAAGHSDNNTDGICDSCSKNLNTNPANCSHLCHKDGFMGFIWKIVRFFFRLLGSNKTCICGVAHY